MDYSKTHYYKYTAPTSTKQARSTIPAFEADDMPAASNTPMARDLITSDDPNFENASPEEGYLPTPSLPSSPATPGITYPNVGGGTPTITFPPTNTRPNNNQNTNSNNLFWSYTWLTPLFGNSSVSSVAQVRFYNVNAMMEPVDIYINGQLITSDLHYTEYTDYLYILPGYYNLTVQRSTNPGYNFLSTRVNFVRNSVCTVSLIGSLDSPGLQFIC